MLWTIVALVAAVVVNVVLGMLWYSPLLFGKPWMKLRGIDEDNQPEARCGYVVSMTGAVVLGLALLMFYRLMGIESPGAAAAVALMAWIGFVLPAKSLDTAWGGGSWKLFAIDAGWLLVQFVAIGLVMWFVAPTG